MSFDLSFLRPGETFEDATNRSEDAPDDVDLTSADLERWESVLAYVRPLLPDAEEFVGDAHRELSDLTTGLQLTLSPGELDLTVPYHVSGSDAERMVGRLRAVAQAVESATGSTAWDPQADAPFTGSSDRTAAAVFDQVADVLPRLTEPSGHRADEPRRRGLFRRRR